MTNAFTVTAKDAFNNTATGYTGPVQFTSSDGSAVLPGLGTRELVDPALMVGLIQLVPEYTGSALDFVSLGRVHATASVTATAGALARSMASRGLVTGRPAAADRPRQDRKEVVSVG